MTEGKLLRDLSRLNKRIDAREKQLRRIEANYGSLYELSIRPESPEAVRIRQKLYALKARRAVLSGELTALAHRTNFRS